MSINQANMTSKAQTGTTTYPVDTRRNYLFIVASGVVTVSVGGGDAFNIPDGGHWEPSVCPTCALVIVGTCVVVTDATQA